MYWINTLSANSFIAKSCSDWKTYKEEEEQQQHIRSLNKEYAGRRGIKVKENDTLLVCLEASLATRSREPRRISRASLVCFGKG